LRGGRSIRGPEPHHPAPEPGRTPVSVGSLTEDLEQVDDGSYEITEDGTFVISKEFPDVTFHYMIDGDELELSPVLTQALKKEALAHPLDFSAAGWAITMSYPGQVWKRVDCSGRC
jgi:hypothetical protein